MPDLIKNLGAAIESLLICSFTWLQGYNIFTDILLSAEDTTKEAAGLVAHSYVPHPPNV